MEKQTIKHTLKGIALDSISGVLIVYLFRGEKNEI